MKVFVRTVHEITGGWGGGGGGGGEGDVRKWEVSIRDNICVHQNWNSVSVYQVRVIATHYCTCPMKTVLVRLSLLLHPPITIIVLDDSCSAVHS